MVDTGGGGGGNDPWKNNFLKSIGGFCKDSSYWALGGFACWLKYKSMASVAKKGTVGKGPAFVFVAIYGLINFTSYQYCYKQIKNNARLTYRHIKDFDEYKKN